MWIEIHAFLKGFHRRFEDLPASNHVILQKKQETYKCLIASRRVSPNMLTVIGVRSNWGVKTLRKSWGIVYIMILAWFVVSVTDYFHYWLFPLIIISICDGTSSFLPLLLRHSRDFIFELTVLLEWNEQQMPSADAAAPCCFSTLCPNCD